MKPEMSAKLSLELNDILMKESDEQHILSMPVLQSMLTDRGIEADRRTVYRSIRALQDTGHSIVYVRGKVQGYYAEHLFSSSEAAILASCLNDSAAVSKTNTDHLLKNISTLLSVHQQSYLSAIHTRSIKTGNDQVLAYIDLLIPAIQKFHPVRFRYYDLNLSGHKQYRRRSKPYEMMPYALVLHNARYYCILYAKEHQAFASFRIDKMDQLSVLENTEDPVAFDLESYMRSSFDMYSGTPQTVTAVFDLSLSSIVFDRFSEDILISHISDTSFTASIRTAVTPTLVSWILMFPGKIQVAKPQSLIDTLLSVADSIHTCYRKEL